MNGEPAVEKVGAVVAVYQDGPILVRGDYVIVSGSGEVIERDRGVVALCRCGRSLDKPFCDGTHALSARDRRG